MYALLLALLTQLDMSGEQLLMAGNSPAVSNRVPPAPLMVDRKEPVKKRILDFYGPSWCPNCPGILAVVAKELGNEFEIRVFKDFDTYPDWVLVQGNQSGWGYPMLRWTNHAGESQIALWSGIENFRKFDGVKRSSLRDEAAPTPGQEVERVIGLLPKPQIGFVDFGCGDARWCIAAAERWGCRVTGIEIDPERAQLARERVKNLNLDHLITIIEGDATQVEIQSDVVVAYLYSDVLEKLVPKIRNLQAFASYMHRPPGLPVIQNGDTWFYTKAVRQSRTAIWDGLLYSQPICNRPNCAMCNSIRRQISATY